jgi:hypothetical protein
VNLSDTAVTNKGIQLLIKGLKYIIHKNHQTWIKTVAIEADAAGNKLDEKVQK